MNRDMYYEKWGFMLIFWNLAGVPLSYCHCTIYLANHDPSTYRHSWPVLALFFTSYLFMYWVWDTGNSQKNMFRAQERGYAMNRKTFPQLPWKAVKNPKKIETASGDTLLCDGWYGYARKVRVLLCLGSYTANDCCTDPLHLRPLLRAYLGPDHRLQ